MADNQKMWAELGMNLEMHDMLCEVLPGAIGDVFMSQENRPEAMDYFDMVLADVHGLRPSELVEFRKNGGKVFGTFCAYVPDEVIFAAGGIATGLCAGSQFWVPGGERYLPANTCPLIKAMLGARFDKGLKAIAEKYSDKIVCAEGLDHLAALHFHTVDEAAAFAGKMKTACIDSSVMLYKANCVPALLLKPPVIASEATIDYILNVIDTLLA